ncbi:hypothetical protein LguiB_001417 [Lonicera macranthoides]
MEKLLFHLIHFSIEVFEALAVLFAVDQAISPGWTKVEFESALKIISSINSGVTQLNEISSILDSIRKKSYGRDYFSFCFSSR